MNVENYNKNASYNFIVAVKSKVGTGCRIKVFENISFKKFSSNFNNIFSCGLKPSVWLKTEI